MTMSAPTARAEMFPAPICPVGGVPVGFAQPDTAPPKTTSPAVAPASIRSSRRLTARLEQLEQRSVSSLAIFCPPRDSVPWGLCDQADADTDHKSGLRQLELPGSQSKFPAQSDVVRQPRSDPSSEHSAEVGSSTADRSCTS